MDLVSNKVRFSPSDRYPIDARQRSCILEALCFFHGNGVNVRGQCAYESGLLNRILRNMEHSSDHVVVTHGLHFEACLGGMRLYFDVKINSKSYPSDRTIHVYVEVIHVPIMFNAPIPGMMILDNGTVALDQYSHQPRLRVVEFSM